jgi:hypothetical protein
MAKSELFKVVWRFLTAAAGILGVSLLFTTSRAGNLFYYFTTQSNILVVILFVVLATTNLVPPEAREKGRSGTVIQPALHLAVVFYITITFLVFALLLSQYLFSMGKTSALSMILTHYIVPIMAIVDWICFQPHGRVGYRAALAWLSYPLAYFAFSLLRALFGHPSFDRGSKYPYFFIDADRLGWANLAWIVPAFTAVFLLLGLGMVFVDKKLARIIR